MNPAVRTRETVVKFYVEAWDEAATEANAHLLVAMERYVRSAEGMGLTNDEVAEDLMSQFPDLGCIEVTSAHSADVRTVWVDIEAA